MLHSPLRDHPRLIDPSKWPVPELYNIGVDISDRWAALDRDRPALVDATIGSGEVTTFGALRKRSNRLARALVKLGIRRGDRVAVLLPQRADVIVAHAAIYKSGAIVVPLASVFGADALRFRLADCGARAAVTDAAGATKLTALDPRPRALETVICVDGHSGSVLGLEDITANQPEDFEPVATRADDPALMIYTSGTTGQPKGALHAHRVLLGHLSGVQFSHDGFPRPGDLMWTPADWAWAGGLLNAVLPALHFGVPVLARRSERFDPDVTAALLRDFGVRNAFMPPTALRMMRAHAPGPFSGLALRSLSAAGEALGIETEAWARRAFGVPVNEVYGQTECNYVLGSAAASAVFKPGAIGRTVPGHEVAVIRPEGIICEPGEPGGIAVARPDPAMFLGYWNQPDATMAKFVGRWMTTGDQAVADADGFVTFLGRDDDIITSSGFRIGPGEIEDCLLRHPAVASAAVVGKPDAIRTEIVKAFVVLRDGFAPTSDLETEIKGFVRTRLSAHEYPRELAFVPDLPTTATGKLMRRVLRDGA